METFFFRGMQAIPNHLQIQQWHPRRLGCDCLSNSYRAAVPILFGCWAKFAILSASEGRTILYSAKQERTHIILIAFVYCYLFSCIQHYRPAGRHFTGGRKKFALKITICRNYTDHREVNIHWLHCIENFFTVQDFWATCACPKNRVCPENFHCIEIFFIIKDFWATCACPEIFQAGVAAAPRLCSSHYVTSCWTIAVDFKFEDNYSTVFFKENVRYPVSASRDPIPLILGTRRSISLILWTRWSISVILGTRIGSLKHFFKKPCNL